MRVPVSVLIPTRNEAANLPRCLAALEGWADEIVVVDSQSTDDTVAIAQRAGAQVLQFHYDGGWPKKRQWALDNHPFRNDWILLLDADEILLPAGKEEIASKIKTSDQDGYYLRLEMIFLGRRLRHGGFHLEKLALFRRGMGRFERRHDRHTKDMSDIEVHEHVKLAGKVGRIRTPVEHHNVHSLHRYLAKHNEYSTWQAEVAFAAGRGQRSTDELEPSLRGSQAQRRRWLKNALFKLPGFSIALFLYRYVFRLGFLDGRPGLIYCGLQAVQEFHTKAKLYEIELARGER